jgi:hypothetical protein
MNIESFKFYSIIVLITIITTTLSFSLLGLILEAPNYSKYCIDLYYTQSPNQKIQNCTQINTPDLNETNECHDINGNIRYIYKNGCAVSYICETCNYSYEQDLIKYKKINFVITSLIGIILIIISLKYKIKKNTKSWFYSSIILSGIVILTFSTLTYYSAIDRMLRPVILIVELLLIISLAKKNLIK